MIYSRKMKLYILLDGLVCYHGIFLRVTLIAKRMCDRLMWLLWPYKCSFQALDTILLLTGQNWKLFKYVYLVKQVLRGFLSHICLLGKWRWNNKKIGGICFVIRHFVPDIWYSIRLEKHVHVFCKASVLGRCLMACSWLPTNKTKQSGSLLCDVYYIGGSGLRFKQKWVRLSSSKKLHQNTNPRNHKQVHHRRRAQKFNGWGIPYPRPWSRAWQFLLKQNPRGMFKHCMWVKISKHGCWSFFSMQICYTSNPQSVGRICSPSWINQLTN